MGDKMLEQKYSYSEQCFTPKKTFVLSKELEFGKSACLTATVRIEKKCCINGIRQITEGGTMCSTDDQSYYARDFDSFMRKNGSERSRDNFFVIEQKKGKTTIRQYPAQQKMVKLTDDEFEQSFTKSEISWNAALRFDQGVPICRSIEERDSQNFYGVDASLTKSFPDGIEEEPVKSVAVNAIGATKNITLKTRYSSAVWTLNEEEFSDSFEETSKVVVVESGFQRSIEYAGKTGNTVKFIYSEFKDNMARDAFTREFSVDLSGDNVAAYKGAVFEIVEATNSTIEYKVIRNFPAF